MWQLAGSRMECERHARARLSAWKSEERCRESVTKRNIDSEIANGNKSILNFTAYVAAGPINAYSANNFKCASTAEYPTPKWWKNVERRRRRRRDEETKWKCKKIYIINYVGVAGASSFRAHCAHKANSAQPLPYRFVDTHSARRPRTQEVMELLREYAASIFVCEWVALRFIALRSKYAVRTLAISPTVGFSCPVPSSCTWQWCWESDHDIRTHTHARTPNRYADDLESAPKIKSRNLFIFLRHRRCHHHHGRCRCRESELWYNCKSFRFKVDGESEKDIWVNFYRCHFSGCCCCCVATFGFFAFILLPFTLGRSRVVARAVTILPVAIS